jgi:hypothetical protein
MRISIVGLVSFFAAAMAFPFFIQAGNAVLVDSIVAPDVAVDNEAQRIKNRAEELREQRSILDRQIDSLEDRADDLADSAEDLRDDDRRVTPRDQARAIKDTVLVLTRATAREVMGSFTGRDNLSSRQQGFGGAAGFEPALFATDFRPVSRLVNKVPLLRDAIGFSVGSSYYILSMMGGSAYGGIGHGVRIGGGGWGGHTQFTRTVGDTDYTLQVGIGYGGVLIEKALVRGEFNWSMGGLFGAGGIGVELSTVGEGDAFHDLNNTANRMGAVGAAFMLIEIHGGVTYSLLSWMHIGGEVALPCFFASDGFRNASGQSVTDGFFTVNPGIRLRIVLGNLG